MKTCTAVVSLGVIAGFAMSAVADHDHRNNRQRVFRAQLTSYNEVPTLSTDARGQFYAVVNKEETEIRYWLSFSDLSATVAQAHIHIGQHHTNGGIMVWLCGGTLPGPAGTPPCSTPPGTSAIVSGLLASANVLAVPAQSIATGDAGFQELVAAMRAGAAYVNVHSGAAGNPNADPPTTTTGFPPGEIRGQVE
jgi:hypothetical protein